MRINKKIYSISISSAAWLLLLFISGPGMQVLANNGLPVFTDIIEQNASAVVNISTSRTQDISKLFKLPPELEGTPQGDLFKKFFEDQGPDNRESLSLGSGAIVSSDGYVVTNNHVISEADKILVKLSDKREYPAKLVGADKATDIALLKINAKDLPKVAFGDSDQLKVGEWVVAIGSPFGFEFSATAGIVSAKGRSIGRERYVPFIQSDVAINPGNSGGPLFNLDGKVVGINAQILSKTGGYLGLSFAIPVNIVRTVITQLKENGFVDRGWLGIAFQDVDRDLAKSFGLDRAAGALVANVIAGSPSEKAGIKTGDIIIKFHGEKVVDATQLPAMVGSMSPGTVVDVTFYRAGKQLETKLTIGRMQQDVTSKLAPDDADSMAGQYNILGIVVKDLTEGERKGANLPKGGVLITGVDEHSIAENIGLISGDIILAINMKPVDNLAGFSAQVEALPTDKWIPILIQNDGGIKRYFAFKLTK